MTTQEFSNMFDTLLNSYNTLAMFGETSSRGDIVLDEYEKSVLLTQAQDIIVKSFFERTGNLQGEGFDDSMRRLVDFSSLIAVAEPEPFSEIVKKDVYVPSGTPLEGEELLYVKTVEEVDLGELFIFDERGKLYALPQDLLLLLNEKIIEYNDKDPETNKATVKKSYVVVPINFREYDRQMSKAYNQPLKKQCWRLYQKEAMSGLGITAELIPIEGVKIDKYKIRYIRRPKPIILTNLDFEDLEDLEIDGVKAVSECELNPILHMEILNKAVEMAIATRGSRPLQQTNNQ